MGGNDEDVFWQIALFDEGENVFTARSFIKNDSSDYSDDDSNDADACDVNANARSITYNIPWKVVTAVNEDDNDGEGASTTTTTTTTTTSTVIPLKLSPLPDFDGIWSPLGAQAWHASSLLVAYALQLQLQSSGGGSSSGDILKSKDSLHSKASPSSLLARYIESWYMDVHAHQDNNNNNSTTTKPSVFTALELGSGAVGLAGIAIGLILAEYASSSCCDNKNQHPNVSSNMAPRVILTDNETNVVKHLQENVDRALSSLEGLENDSNNNSNTNNNSYGITLLPDLQVQYLDWGHYETSQLQKDNHSSLQLVFGSELVYTGETANVCAAIVLELLRANPDALVFIIQVTDRDGWTNVFLPTLRQYDFVQILEESLEDSYLHPLAETIIPPAAGGALDRSAFGGCYIFNSNGNVAALLS